MDKAEKTFSPLWSSLKTRTHHNTSASCRLCCDGRMTLETTTPIIVNIRGAWSGEVEDPHRAFAGIVIASDLSALQAGDQVSVRYHSSRNRVPGATEHGHYSLSAAGHEWPLMRFGVQANTGGHRRDDTHESEWLAEVLPAKVM
jgi:hypothetical protein